MKALLIDEDRDFAGRFSMYIAENCRDVMLTVIRESDRKSGSSNEDTAFLNELKSAELVLADYRSVFLKSDVPAYIAVKTVVLTTDPDRERTVDDRGMRYLFKYERAPSLISSIAELAETYETGKTEMKVRDSLRIISVTGFHGGAGRTSFAYALGRINQTVMNKDTLLIPSQRLSDIGEYFSSADDGSEAEPHNGTAFCSGPVSDVNLMLLNFLSGMKIVPGRYLVRDESGVCTFAFPKSSPSDMPDLSGPELKRLLALIGDWGIFDTLVADLGGAEQEIEEIFLEMSDTICIIRDARRMESAGESAWTGRMRSRFRGKKTITICNRCHDEVQPASVQFMEREAAGITTEYSVPEEPDGFRIINMKGALAGIAEAVLRESMS